MSLKEWKRLERDAYHRLEFDTTTHFLKKYLPPRGLVLDAGGGPGRYAIHLAKMGYNVVLLDFTPELLDKARRQIKRAKVEDKIDRIIHGTMCDLSSFDDRKFDAVLCLGGALSHVLDRHEREKAVHELIRVAKKGAPMFVSVIGQMALLVTELVRFPHEIEMDLFRRIRETGDYYGGCGFAPCHFYNPEEIEKEFENEGLAVLEMAGLEGLASGHPKETNRLYRKYPKAWKIWWETHLKTCMQPTSVGISEHFIIVCRK
jgi:ubiquinone/menaquinone biosynthesis C-methylase UbiE